MQTGVRILSCMWLALDNKNTLVVVVYQSHPHTPVRLLEAVELISDFPSFCLIISTS